MVTLCKTFVGVLNIRANPFVIMAGLACIKPGNQPNTSVSTSLLDWAL